LRIARMEPFVPVLSLSLSFSLTLFVDIQSNAEGGCKVKSKSLFQRSRTIFY
jgi:hypothetical protein